MKIFHRVAGFAAVLIRSGGELLIMGVLVAIGAGREFDLVQSVLPRGDVAFLAGHRGMPSFERVVGRGMLLHAEQRGFPTVDGVAFRALAFACPRLKLPLVRIRIVTIRALGEFQWLLEIPSRVAIGAAYFQMCAEQGIFRFCVVEQA